MKSFIPQSTPLLNLMRGPVTRIAISGTCLWMTACASIVGKSQYPVTVSSNPPGANFTIKKSNGMAMSTGVTPATVTLSSSFGYFQPAKYLVEFTRKGTTQTVPLNASVSGWYFANLISWGIIGGMLIVDPATGAMWRLDDSVIATFNQAPDASPESTKKGLKVVTIDKVPRSMRKHLVSLN